MQVQVQALIDQVANSSKCVTISLDIKFIGATKLDDEIIGFTKIQKKTKSMVFLICHLNVMKNYCFCIRYLENS